MSNIVSNESEETGYRKTYSVTKAGLDQLQNAESLFKVFDLMTFRHMRPVKIQISLRIRAGWSESSLGAFWKAKDTKFLRANDEESDETVRVRRLIWVFVGRTYQEVRLLTNWSIRLIPLAQILLGH